MLISHLLAVVPVRDIDRGTEWFERLLGRPADARPMLSLADFHVTDSGWLQVHADPDRAGSAQVNLAVDDFDATVATLAERGVDVSGVFQATGPVRLLPITDPDGNVVTVIGSVRDQ